MTGVEHRHDVVSEIAKQVVTNLIWDVPVK